MRSCGATRDKSMGGGLFEAAAGARRMLRVPALGSSQRNRFNFTTRRCFKGRSGSMRKATPMLLFGASV